MADPHNVEFEAAKFLQKLIHESTDEPAKLATKLYVILQHMKASGKENSMPYQVISRAMETVINQHGLDIEALMSSRLPGSSGSHGGEAARAQSAGGANAIDAKSGLIDNDTSRPDGFGSGRPPAAPSSVGNDPFQGSVSQRSAMSFDHESPSSMDTRSTNSHSQDRRDLPGWEQQGIQKDPKRANIKRKRADSSGMETHDDISQQLDSHSGIPDVRKERFTCKPEAGGTFPVDSESWKQGLFKGATSFRERSVSGPPSSGFQVDSSRMLTSASSLDSAGMSHIPANADRLSQGGNPSNLCEVGIPASSASRDTGKGHAIPSSGSSMPFKEHHLKQLRAQCLVFLAFRNGVPPKKLHLEIALGNMLPKEGTSSGVGAQNELIQDKGKQQTTLVPLPHGNIASVNIDGAPAVSSAADLVPKGPENVKSVVGLTGSAADPSPLDEENPDVANSSAFMTASLQPDTFGMRSPATHIHEENLQPGAANHAAALMSLNRQLKPEMNRWSRVNHNDISRGTLPASFQPELGNSNESPSVRSQSDNNIQNQQHADTQMSTTWKSVQPIDSGHHRARPDANMLFRNTLHDGNGALENQTRYISDGSKVALVSDSSYMSKDSSSLASIDKLPDPEEGDLSISANLQLSPKHTLSEKWIMAHQKKKIATEQKWVQKLQKADQRIATRFSELKETVSSSADISGKTRSVIELKKLQLLELQRCLRRNILSDFFKPIQTEMDRLKSIKKHRIGRRLKHVEKYEQKMKEERQKRIRERQKEFFSEVEVHKERLEDVFKYKRERCKNFNRYVKEYHKRKERIHREKIDRIQREKINLLKINDVEGYLRMVQDAKSDRVNKLLKETEKYLQKLGSRLKEAKAAARQVEMDDRAIIDDSSDIFTVTEDENDQAKHYKESNEKYYLIAHSIKENIAEQPTELCGGKLREYQMNGLRWLVSLYNNHLNGILADEMGLGKTVQVISLICYLMESKNDRGPFLVVVPSSVLPGWEHELSFWAPSINKIVYAGPPEERRRLFKESIVHQKFNVLLTTYEYLMNKHDRPKLSKIHWHYIIIDEGHRIKNASCKLNADLKHYNSTHRLLLTGTPLQNNLEELWALLNFLLPNIFNSSEDFSQWFNKPFESNGDNSADETLLSEEENLLIINRLHQVLRPFVLRRLKHKVENELPEKIERLIRCEASAYQKLLMKRVEENLGSLGVSKARAVHNSVMELRNICNHPYLSQLHAEEVDSYIPKHFLPPIVRLCGKLEMLDRLLPKLKETNHRVLFFSTMTRLLDVMEEYLVWKKYRYLRLDGHTSGLDRGALIDKFNHPDSPFFIFLLSIRAGGVGVNLQAADTVIIFDTDWNPQVDLQAQARAHRIGQKKDVLVLRLETVNTVEEQVRAAAEHKLGVANQSITAGFFDNNTSAEDRREYLESLLRESKKEEAAPVLDDDSLNDILARSESEIDVFEAIDQKRREEEMATWKRLVSEKGGDCSDVVPSLPPRLVTDDDLTAFYEAMKIHDIPNDEAGSSSGMKRKSGCLGAFDTQQYGRGKRAREVRSYEEQWTEEEFEKICQAESPEALKPKDEKISLPAESSETSVKVEPPMQIPQAPIPSLEVSPLVKKEVTPPVKRGRGRPRRLPTDSPSTTTIGVGKSGSQLRKGIDTSTVSLSGSDSIRTPFVTKESSRDPVVSKEVRSDPVVTKEAGRDPVVTKEAKRDPVVTKEARRDNLEAATVTSQSSNQVLPSPSVDTGVQPDPSSTSVAAQPKRHGRKGQPMEKNIDGNTGTENVRRRGRKPGRVLSPVPSSSNAQDSKLGEKPRELSSDFTVSTLTVSSSNPADGVGASHATAIEDSKECTLVTEKTSSDKLDQASASVQDPKLNDQSTNPSILDSSSVALGQLEASSVSKGDPVTLDKLASMSGSSSVAPTVGTNLSSNSITELPKVTAQTSNSSSELGLPSPVGLRPGRRQNQKPQSGIEPVKRRGRKRGSIASTGLGPPGHQDKNVIEPGKNTGSPPTSTVTNVATPSGPAIVGMDPCLAAVPIIPVVPVSGFIPAATPLTGKSVLHVSKGLSTSIPASSQQSLVSGTPDMPPGILKSPVSLPPQGPDQRVQPEETAPRRRGRKRNAASPADNLASQNLSSSQSNRSTGDFVESKVIATRSRQINISQVKNSPAEVNNGNSSMALNSQNLVPMQSSKPPSQVVSPSNQGSSSIEAGRASKHPELTLANPREDPAVCRIPAQSPPISCKGKTNVIVLALELTTLDVSPTGHSCTIGDGKEECLSLQLAPTVQVSGLDTSLTAEIQAPTQDDDLSAPPGFDTPRSGVSDTAVKKPFKSDDCGTPISDAKTGSVVLALESTSQTVVPSAMPCEKRPEEQECSGSQRVKDLVLGSIPPVEPIEHESGSEPVDKLTSQSEDEMSAPPGFDIPQRCISQNAVAMPLEVVHGLASDIKANIASKSKAEESSRGHNVGDVLTASHMADLDAEAVSTLEAKKEDRCGPNDSNVAHEAGSAPGVLSAVSSDTAVTSIPDSKEMEENLEPGIANVETEADNVGYNDVASSNLETKQKEECHASADVESEEKEGFFELNNANAGSSSSLNVSSVNVASSLDFKEKEECHESDNVHGENNSDSMVTGILASASLNSEDNKKCQELNNENAKNDDSDNVVSDVVASQGLKSEAKDEIHEPDNADAGDDAETVPLALKEKEGCPEHVAANAEDKVDNVVSIDVASSSFEIKGKEECHELDNANAENDTESMVTDTLASASLDSKDEQTCQELDNANARNDDSENVVAVMVASQGSELEAKEDIHVQDENNAIVPSSTSDFNEKERFPEPDVVNAGDNANIVASSSFELKEKEECHEPDNSNADNDTDIMVTDTLASASFDSKDEQTCQELDNTNARIDDSENVVSDIVPSQGFESEAKDEIHEPVDANAGDGADTVASSNMDLKEKEGCHEPDNVNAGDNADCVVSKSMASSSFVVTENEECNETDNGSAENIADNVVTDVMVSSCLEIKEKEECQQPDNASPVNDTAKVVPDVAASSLELKEKEVCQVPVGDEDKNDATNTRPASPAVSSDTAASSPVESKEEKEIHGHNDVNVELNVDEAPTNSCIIGSDTQIVLIEEIKEKRESPGPEDGSIELNAIEHVAPDTSPVCIVASDNRASSTLESKEKQESVNGSSTSTNPEVADATINVVESEMVSASTLEFKGEGDGLNEGNVEQVGDAPATSHVTIDDSSASKLEKEE